MLLLHQKKQILRLAKHLAFQPENPGSVEARKNDDGEESASSFIVRLARGLGLLKV
jgi:hypothetical protein